MNHDKRCVTIKAVSLMLCVSDDSLVSFIDIMRLHADAVRVNYKHDHPATIRYSAAINKLKADCDFKISETIKSD